MPLLSTSSLPSPLDRLAGPPARAAALGAASGARTTYGLAAVAWGSTPAGRGPLRVVAGSRGRTVTAAAAGLESLLDTLPVTPSRLRPPALLGRLALGAGSAVLVAQRDGTDVSQAARVGAGAALGGALAGAAWRFAGARRGRRDLPRALGEDLVAAALALWGARQAPVRDVLAP